MRKHKKTPVMCPSCHSILTEQIYTHIYFSCSSSFNINNNALDRSKRCLTREKMLVSKVNEFLTSLKKKKK